MRGEGRNLSHPPAPLLSTWAQGPGAGPKRGEKGGSINLPFFDGMPSKNGKKVIPLPFREGAGGGLLKQSSP